MNLKKRLLIAELIEFPLIAAILFLAAGTIAWTVGWIFIVLFTGLSVALSLWLLKHSPGLLQERMAVFKSNQKLWDKVFIIVIMILFIAWLILMPLDAVRYQWSRIPLWLNIAGFLILLCSYYIFYLVFRENPYLSATVRIQEERGQTVISTGPYSHIRHPMYAAALLFFTSTALLLGSWYGVILGLIFACVLAIRAVLEERTLREELEGYDEYMERVRHRLIPRVW